MERRVSGTLARLTFEPLPHPILIVLVTVLVLVAGWVSYASVERGIRITVVNAGQETVRDMTVYVTGASYPLGDLAPSTSRTCQVSPTSESHVELEFADEQRGRVRLNAGGYFEPGYRGTMEIQVRDGEVVGVKHDINITRGRRDMFAFFGLGPTELIVLFVIAAIGVPIIAIVVVVSLFRRSGGAGHAAENAELRAEVQRLRAEVDRSRKDMD